MPARLKLGVQLPEVERVIRWPELAQMARRIEAMGLDSIWVGDHLLYRWPDGTIRGPWECWTILAAIAAVTSRVELAPFVASTAFHNPAMLAKKAATLDEVSGGRLILALGAGWNRTEFEAFGFPYDHRVARFEEAFTIIRTLLREGRIDFEGRFHTLRDCVLDPRGPRSDGPPLVIGSAGPRMLRIGLPHVDGWNVWFAEFGNDPANFPAVVRRVEAACREVGRDPAEVEATAAAAPAVRGTTAATQLQKPRDGRTGRDGRCHPGSSTRLVPAISNSSSTRSFSARSTAWGTCSIGSTGRTPVPEAARDPAPRRWLRLASGPLG